MTKSIYEKNKIPLGKKFIAGALIDLADKLYESSVDFDAKGYDKEVKGYILANCTLLVELAKREIR